MTHKPEQKPLPAPQFQDFKDAVTDSIARRAARDALVAPSNGESMVEVLTRPAPR